MFSLVFQLLLPILRLALRDSARPLAWAVWLVGTLLISRPTSADHVELTEQSTSTAGLGGSLAAGAAGAELWVRAPRALRERGQLDQAGPVTVLNGLELRRSYSSPAAALAEQPGLAVLSTGSAGSPAHLMVRGATAEQVAIAIDDVPIGNGDGAPFDLSDLPLTAVERLEVYRGATPAWLGPQSVGGALRILLRKARGTHGELSATLGSFGTRQLDGGVGWQGDKGSALAGLRWLDSAGNFGYRQDPGTAFVASDDNDQTRANNDVRRLGGVLVADLKLDARWTAYLRWLGAGSERGIPGAALYPALHARYLQNRQLLALQAVRQSPADRGRLLLSLHASGAWTQTDDRQAELGLAWHSRQRITGAGAMAAWEGPIFERSFVAANGQLRLAGQMGGVDGQDLLRDEARPRSWRNSASLTAALPITFGNFVVTPAAGAEWVAQKLHDARQFPFAWAEVTSGQAPPWHAALSGQWRPDAAWTLHTSVRRAVRLANLQELFGDSAVIRGNARLQPESSVALDAGVNWHHSGGKDWELLVDTRGYVSWADDLIQLVGLGTRQAIYQNIGEARLAGAELQVDARLGRVRSSAGHTTMVNVDQSQRVAYHGNALPMWPRSRWSGRVAWQIPATSSLFNASLWTAGQWQSGYFLDAANLVAIPSRVLLSAGVRIDLPASTGLHIDARLDNVGGSAWFDLVGYPLPGRTAWLQVGWSGRQRTR